MILHRCVGVVACSPVALDIIKRKLWVAQTAIGDQERVVEVVHEFSCDPVLDRLQGHKDCRSTGDGLLNLASLLPAPDHPLSI